MNLTITPEVEALLQHEMATGKFQDVNDLIATAVHVLSDTTPADLNEFRSGIEEGLADIENGDTYSEEEARAYIRDLRAKL